MCLSVSLMVDFESASEIPMTPDRSVIWNVIDCPEIGGSMLVSPDCSEEVLGVLRKVAVARTIDPNVSIGRPTSGGASSIVYEWPRPHLALKVIHDFKLPLSEYEALKANVTLSEGFKRIQPAPSKTAYTAPDYFGAYFPYEIGGRGTSVWAMTFESGKGRHELSSSIRRTIPTRRQRAAVYGRALRACGGHLDQYDLDMDDTNEIFRVPPSPQQEASVGRVALTIVKLDISDRRSLLESLKMR
jgi:hypothetical protein